MTDTSAGPLTAQAAEPLDRLADALFASLGTLLVDPLFAAATRLLAEGRPVTLAELGRSLGVPPGDLAARIATTPNLEVDASLRVVGAALTLVPTAHRVRLRGRELFTWCAFDTLLLPALLGEPLEVETPDPVTGTMVRLVAGPGHVEWVSPPGVVAMVVVPSADQVCCGVRGAFCDYAWFFSSEERARAWLDARGATARGTVLSLADAFELGRRLVARRGGSAADARAGSSDRTTWEQRCV